MSYKRYEIYRFNNQDGTQKVWAIRTNGDSTFTTAWGKLTAKKTLNTKGISHPDDVHKLIRSKERKGYVHDGEMWINDEGESTTSPELFDLDPHVKKAPVLEPTCIYWRIRIPTPMMTGPEVSFLKGAITGYADFILKAYPDCLWVENIRNGHGDFIKPGAGSLTKELGVASLLLLMAVKKMASNGITISLSHEDGIEISDQPKLEFDALSFFDTDLESVRHITEVIGLLEKRLDLTTIAPEHEDFYF